MYVHAGGGGRSECAIVVVAAAATAATAADRALDKALRCGWRVSAVCRDVPDTDRLAADCRGDRRPPRLNRRIRLTPYFSGKPHVICEESGIVFNAKTFFPFVGEVFARDRKDNPL